MEGAILPTLLSQEFGGRDQNPTKGREYLTMVNYGVVKKS